MTDIAELVKVFAQLQDAESLVSTLRKRRRRLVRQFQAESGWPAARVARELNQYLVPPENSPVAHDTINRLLS